MVSDEWKEGATAAEDGFHLEANPHPPGSRASNDWKLGWKMAQGNAHVHPVMLSAIGPFFDPGEINQLDRERDQMLDRGDK